MIPGDIDLTEKLDFRKTVKKEIPQLPDIWNKGKNELSNYIDTNISFTISNSDEYRITYSNDYDVTTTTYRYDLRLSDWFEYNTTVTTNSTSSNSVSITGNNYYWVDSSASSLEYVYSDNINDNDIHFISIEDKYDVFGNKKITPKHIPKIPWKEARTERMTSIPWNRKDIYDDDDLWKIPRDWIGWDNKDSFEFETADKYNKAINLISWLSKKTKRFINDYFDIVSDKDLSYLTNMSWIRVKDAVID